VRIFAANFKTGQHYRETMASEDRGKGTDCSADHWAIKPVPIRIGLRFIGPMSGVFESKPTVSSVDRRSARLIDVACQLVVVEDEHLDALTGSGVFAIRQ